jgi:hypothetical protein
MNNPRFDANHLIRPGCPGDFDAANRRKLQSGKRNLSGIALGNSAGQLSRGFDEQHAGKERLTGKMSAKKRFVTANAMFAHAALPRLKAQQTIQEPEFRSVRQELQRLLQSIR